MANQDNRDEQTKNQRSGSSSGGQTQSDDPGRTPGKAEGDEATVDESLRQKENSTK